MHPPAAGSMHPSPDAGQRASHAVGRDVRIVGAGEPLVLVPGLDGTGRLFHRQIPGLATHYRVGNYALRDEAPAMETLIEDLAAVVRTVGGGAPATIVGESFGGALSLSFALAHPALVRRLVILNSFAHFLPQYRLALAIAGLHLMPWGAMPVVRRATAFRMHSRFTHREQIRDFLAITRQTTKRGYLARLRILRAYDVRARLHEIQAPTLLLAADRDHLVPSVEQARYMAARLPHATVHVLDGHGHICLIAPMLHLSDILADWSGRSAVNAPALRT